MSAAPDPFQCVLVRNVMVGRKGLTRALPLDAFTAAGGEVRSLLATGNIVLRAADPDAPLVAAGAARLLHEAVGLSEP